MKHMINALKMLFVLTILTGIIYPLLITGIAQVCYNEKANGDPSLIGQKFDKSKYFWSRPSSVDYATIPSGASNLSATSKSLKDQVQKRKDSILSADPTKKADQIPSDMIYASGSGLDPHISYASAVFQADRVAKARGMNKDTVLKMISQVREGRDFFTLGDRRVNVLKLNILLDKSSSKVGK
jgi:potassium-transporting ATPase KdpC subunit